MKIWVGRTLHKIFGYSEVILMLSAERSSHQSQICRLETRHIALLCVVTVTSKLLISNIFPLYGGNYLVGVLLCDGFIIHAPIFLCSIKCNVI